MEPELEVGASAAPVTDTSPVDAPAVASVDTPPSASVDAPVAAPVDTSSSSWQGVRDFARAQGVELPHENDAAALQSLIAAHQQLQQRNYYAELGQRIAPHAGELQRYLQSRQAQPQVTPAWQPPEFQKEWLKQVERDPETGLLRAKPGYDPGLPARVQAYADWRDRFLDSPEQVIGPLVEQRSRQIVREEQGVYQSQALANSLIAADSHWMFEEGPRGRTLTPAGQHYATMAKNLWDGGLRDINQIHAMSRATIENAVLRQQIQSLRPAAVNAPLAEQPVNAGGSAARPANGAPPVAPGARKGLSLREALMANLGQFEDTTSM